MDEFLFAGEDRATGSDGAGVFQEGRQGADAEVAVVPEQAAEAVAAEAEAVEE